MSVTDIVDTHIHFLDPKRFSYPWLARRPDVDRLFLYDDYDRLIGKNTVSRVVLIEGATQDSDAASEAEWLVGIAANTASVGALVAQARLERGMAVKAELDQLAQFPIVKGIRRVVRAPFQSDPDFCVSPDFITGVRLLAQYDLTFDVACGPSDLANVSKLADACSDIQFIVNHMANPISGQDCFAAWESGMRALAQRPNVACKISGLQAHLPTGWGPSIVEPYVNTVVTTFGPTRILFGSDTPVQNAGGGFVPWLSALENIFASASQEEQNLFFYGNACRIYRIA